MSVRDPAPSCAARRYRATHALSTAIECRCAATAEQTEGSCHQRRFEMTSAPRAPAARSLVAALVVARNPGHHLLRVAPTDVGYELDRCPPPAGWRPPGHDARLQHRRSCVASTRTRPVFPCEHCAREEPNRGRTPPCVVAAQHAFVPIGAPGRLERSRPGSVVLALEEVGKRRSRVGDARGLSRVSGLRRDRGRTFRNQVAVQITLGDRVSARSRVDCSSEAIPRIDRRHRSVTVAGVDQKPRSRQGIRVQCSETKPA